MDLFNKFKFCIKNKITQKELTSTIHHKYYKKLNISDKVFNVGIVGAGAMGRDQCLGLKAIPQVKIVAVCDKNKNSLERLGKEVDLTGVGLYQDAFELFKKEELDLVCIATNTNSHLKIAELAVEANIAKIIVEKPIGNKVSAAKSLFHKCREKDIKLTINHSRRWSDTYAAVFRCINKGFIGNLRQINMSIGPGGFAMIGSHFIDLAAYLGNSPIAWVIGFIEDNIEPNKRGPQFKDPGGHALFYLENGIRVLIDLSKDLKRKNKLLSLIGDSGRIEIDERIGEWYITNDFLSRKTYNFTGPTKPAEYFTRVTREILTKAQSSCTAEKAINTLEALIAVHISHSDKNKKVCIPLQGNDAELELPFP